MPANTRATEAQRTNVIAAGEMLARKDMQLCLCEFFDKTPMDMHKASTLKLRRYLPPTVNVDAAGKPVALVEGSFEAAGVNPDFDLLTHEDYEIAMQIYAKSYKITEEVTCYAEDDVRKEATIAIGEWAGYMEELVAYHAGLATTHKYYTNGTATNQVNTAITSQLLSKVERSLMAEKAVHFKKFTTGQTNYKTTPVPATFVLVGHTDLKYDFEALGDKWKPVESYGAQTVIHEFEAGSTGAFRVILTPNFPAVADGGGAAGAMKSTSGANADVYRMLAFGQRAASVVTPKGKKGMKALIVQPDTPSPVDPAGRNGFVTGKEHFAAGITNTAWICEIQAAATNL